MPNPLLIVYSSVFPSSATPNLGLFIRERMFRVAKVNPVVIVSPKPWFPGQFVLRLFLKHYRPTPPQLEFQNGITVYFPRFFSIPGLLRNLDSLFMAVSSYRLLRRLKSKGFNLIDAHFAYPDGHAACLLGRWLDLPVVVTLRGTEVPHSRNPHLKPKVQAVLRRAAQIITVSDSLRRLALELGMPADKGIVVGNGVDCTLFHRVDRETARSRLNLPGDAKVLITVGALVERKGFHRVISCLPALIERHPTLHYLIVGGASPEGNIEPQLKAHVARLSLTERVHFLGPIPPAELKWPLSAADVFVLASSNEGWANVILEAMACGLPVVATDVGGNREVVSCEDLGSIVPFGDRASLTAALDSALCRDWDREAIRAYAKENDWSHRVSQLVSLHTAVLAASQRR